MDLSLRNSFRRYELNGLLYTLRSSGAQGLNTRLFYRHIAPLERISFGLAPGDCAGGLVGQISGLFHVKKSCHRNRVFDRHGRGDPAPTVPLCALHFLFT